uniref:Uncharacterized protein n=1 Tax=Nostoc flagelliforme str. Sunitezuoqi TaxID=676037 RepID=E7DPT5_9NOSO|nr:hypothetical protein Nfla_4301 [Nostoc flagelliforme str. Sunitezuoqi]
MRRYIEKLTSEKYGYTFDEVSEMLLGLGINLSGGLFKYLLGEVKKNTRRRQKKNQSETTTEQVNTEVQSEPVTTIIEVQSEPVNSSKSKRKKSNSTDNGSLPQSEPKAQTF